MNREQLIRRLPVILFFVLSFALLVILWLGRPQRGAPPEVAEPVETVTPRPPRQRTPTSSLPTTTAEPGEPTRTPFVPGTATPGAILPVEPSGRQEFFIAPDGSPDGDGSIERPWDIETALRHPDEIEPGAVLWLREGTYGHGGETRFTSYLTGTEDRPVLLRQYPGERATIDGGILAQGEWTWFWGFEITNSSLNRATNAENRPPGLYMVGKGQKAINLVVHNTGHPGIGFWSDVGDGGEIYGCILWGIGTFDTDREGSVRGSAIYAQNQDGVRYIRDVISFRNLSTGMKAYGEDGYVNGFVFEGNISFSNGDRLIFVSGRDHPVERLVIRDNYTYRSANDPDAPVRLGYTDSDQSDAIVTGNYFVNGYNEDGAFWVKRFRNLVFKNNVVVSPHILSTWIKSETAGTIDWDENEYYGGSFAPFRIDSAVVTFDFWKILSEFDWSSTYSADRPEGADVFVRANEYEPGRGHIAIYNWDLQSAVDVDLSEVLHEGDAYEIVDVQDYFGAPVVSGVYDGREVLIPMNLTTVSAILGTELNITNSHTSPEFGAYVVRKVSQ